MSRTFTRFFAGRLKKNKGGLRPVMPYNSIRQFAQSGNSLKFNENPELYQADT
jgi:hypothetical protein